MRIPVHIAVRATLLAILSPAWFLEFQDRIAKPRGIPVASNGDGAKRVRHAFWEAVILVLFAAFVGFLIGLGLGRWRGSPGQTLIVLLQIVSALILLLATVYVRGDAIRTWHGQALIERVDRWIYCTGYFVGTVTIVVSLVWPL
jgi:hypothetical protein